MKFLAFLAAAFLFAGHAAADGPQRVVTAGGDLTEIVYALGAADRLIGVDSTSNHPAEATAKAQIGYVRQISPEGVLSLTPDLLLGAPGYVPGGATLPCSGDPSLGFGRVAHTTGRLPTELPRPQRRSPSPMTGRRTASRSSISASPTRRALWA